MRFCQIALLSKTCSERRRVYMIVRRRILHLWSRYAGRAEILQLLETLKTVLNDQANLASFISEETLVSASVLYSDVMRASDARTQHGLLRLSLLTEIGVVA